MKKNWGDILDNLEHEEKLKQKVADTSSTYHLSSQRAQRQAMQKNKKKIDKHFLGPEYPGVYFTQREIDCMDLLMKGYTLFKMAEVLGLSPRTIEFYVKNMKMKLACTNKYELVEKILLLK